MSNPLIPGCGFHHVAIRTSDWDKSLTFYCDGLGLARKIAWGEAPKRAVMLDVGDGNYLEIFEREVITENGSTLKGEPNLLHLCLRTNDCESAVETARRAGAEVTVEAKAPDAFTHRTYALLERIALKHAIKILVSKIFYAQVSLRRSRRA